MLHYSNYAGVFFDELPKARLLEQSWPIELWAIFSFHPDGFVREAAVQHLSEHPNTRFTLPFLLLRANDWVHPIRERAAQAIRKHLAPEHTSAWLSCIELINLLRTRIRTDHTWIDRELTALFLRAECRPALTAAVHSKDVVVSRWACRTAMLLPHAERSPFIHAALSIPDTAVRLIAAQTVRAQPETPNRDDLLASMSRDSFMPVRREALYAALDHTPAHRRAVLEAALIDRHASMRHAARVYLRDSSAAADAQQRYHRLYLNLIADNNPATLPIAIAGLGETGTRADLDLLLNFVADKRVRVAAAAVRAVATLDRDHRIEWLIDLLRDNRPAVVKEALRALIPICRTLPPDHLRRVVNDEAHPRARVRALRLLLRRHSYDAAADALNAIATGHEQLAAAGGEFIERSMPWYLYVPPTESQQAATREALSKLPSPLQSELQRKLCELMRLPDLSPPRHT